MKTLLTLDVYKFECAIEGNQDILFTTVSNEVNKFVSIRESIHRVNKPMDVFFCSYQCRFRKREGSDEYFQKISNACLFHTSRKAIFLTKYNNKLMPRKKLNDLSLIQIISKL